MSSARILKHLVQIYVNLTKIDQRTRSTALWLIITVRLVFRFRLGFQTLCTHVHIEHVSTDLNSDSDAEHVSTDLNSDSDSYPKERSPSLLHTFQSGDQSPNLNKSCIVQESVSESESSNGNKPLDSVHDIRNVNLKIK